MMTSYLHRLAVILICMTLLAHASSPQSRKQLSGRQPGQLYKVHNKSADVGFIDRKGNLVIGFGRLPETTVFVRDFREGLAVIYLRKRADDEPAGNMNYDAGYVDETGAVSIALRFDSAYDFSEGLACVEAGESRSFINRRGEVMIKLGMGVEPKLDWYAAGFHEGLAVVTTRQGVGFIDRSGKVVIEGYTAAASFSEGLAAVAIGRGRLAKYGFVNAKGEMVIAPRFAPALSHHDQIEYLGRFSEGLARVRVGDLYGYINKRGRFVIRPQFIHADDFSEGLASVRLREKTGYINKLGHWAVAPRVAPAGGGKFKEGLAPAAFRTVYGTKWGYIDRGGRVFIKPRFDFAYEFVGGVAAVYEVRVPNSVQESRWGYIDKNGKYLWEPQSGLGVRMDVNPYSRH